NPVVTRRAEKLNVDVAQGIDSKAHILSAWIESNGLDPARVAYVGNDINDLEAFDVVGWPIAVADAHPKVLAAARVVLDRPGGRGAVREICVPIPSPAAAPGPLPAQTLPPVAAGEAPLPRHATGHPSTFPDRQPSIQQQQPLLTDHAAIPRADRTHVACLIDLP